MEALGKGGGFQPFWGVSAKPRKSFQSADTISGKLSRLKKDRENVLTQRPPHSLALQARSYRLLCKLFRCARRLPFVEYGLE